MKESTGDPCKDFIIAIVEKAIDDCKYKRKKIREKKSWIEGTLNDPEYYLFEDQSEDFPSFVSICMYFNCDPDYLRDEIRETFLKDIRFNQSALTRLRLKVRDKGEVMRSELSLWAWSYLRLDKNGLDSLLNTLKHRGEVFEFTMRGEKTNRLGRYYMWIGGND